MEHPAIQEIANHNAIEIKILVLMQGHEFRIVCLCLHGFTLQFSHACSNSLPKNRTWVKVWSMVHLSLLLPISEARKSYKLQMTEKCV